MFTNEKSALYMIEGSYKKLKTYFYYDKSLLHIKRKIVDYEATRELSDELSHLAQKLVEKDRVYFDKLINSISYVVYPKSFKGKEGTRVVSGTADKSKWISTVNFSIDMPIELYIIDFCWSLLVGKIAKDKKIISESSYAAKVKKGVFKEGESLLEAIDFISNRCFEPYYNCYTKWRNNALDSAKMACANDDVVMISLDLKSFYYNVNFNFVRLEEILSDRRYNSFRFLSDIVESIYRKYTLCISEIKKGIKKCDGEYMFPIGLASPLFLRDIVLRPIDDNIREALNPLYYGRYVDDMLLVVRRNDLNIDNDMCLFNEVFVEKGVLLCNGKNNEYCFRKNTSLIVQPEKTNFFYFEKGANNVLLDVYFSRLKSTASEANMLPDIDILTASFANEAYKINFNDSKGKLRNIRFLESDNFSATLFINGLKQALMETSYDKEHIDKYLDNILMFYEGSQAIEFMNTWRSIFELFVLCKDINRANIFYGHVNRTINELSLDKLSEEDVESGKKSIVLQSLKENLVENLNLAISLALALDYRRCNYKSGHIDMAKKIRIANMLNHNMVSIPLINYTANDYIIELPFINFDYDDLFTNVYERENRLQLDRERLKWSPRFIHLYEIYLYFFYSNIGVSETFAHDRHDEIFQKYIEINHLSSKIEKPLSVVNTYDSEKLPVQARVLQMNSTKTNLKKRIGLVSTKIDEKDVLNYLIVPQRGGAFESKQKLYKLLNEARRQGVNYLIFPEFYMPSLWLRGVCRFARDAKMSIVSGLQYISCNRQVYNVVCNLQNVNSKWNFKNVIPLFREKNYYAPNELVALAQEKYFTKNPKTPVYYIISDGEIRYSTILCFEFTDIASRYILKGKTDWIFVPQLNRDTNYFSSIVESAARDLHVIVAQANTSKYGDSRITGPYKTAYKDILKIKGGENDILIIGEIAWRELLEFRKNYESKLEYGVENCYRCLRKGADCEQCKMNPMKNNNRIKGLPPNWK